MRRLPQLCCGLVSTDPHARPVWQRRRTRRRRRRRHRWRRRRRRRRPPFSASPLCSPQPVPRVPESRPGLATGPVPHPAVEAPPLAATLFDINPQVSTPLRSDAATRTTPPTRPRRTGGRWGTRGSRGAARSPGHPRPGDPHGCSLNALGVLLVPACLCSLHASNPESFATASTAARPSATRPVASTAPCPFSEQALPGRRVRSRRALSPRSGSAPVRLELAPPQFFVGVRHIGRGRSTRGRGRRPECGARRSLVRGRLGRRRGGIRGEIRSDPRPAITDLSTGRPHTKVMLHLSIQKSIPLAPFRNGSYRVSHISFSSAYFMFSYRSGENPVVRLSTRR